MMLDWLVLGSRMWNEGQELAPEPRLGVVPVIGRVWTTRHARAAPCLENHVSRPSRSPSRSALPDGGRVGLVHGYVTGIQDLNWDDLCTRIRRDHHAAWSAMWSRPDMRRCSPTDPDLPTGVPGVDYVCHSHDAGHGTRLDRARNMLCIDTGVHVPEMGHLTLAELRPGAPVLHSFERIDSLLPEAEPRRS